MDPVLKLYLYEQWLGDHRDDAELAKNHAYLIGSFWNPEAVKQLMSNNTHESTNEEYEESLRIVKEANAKPLEIQSNTTTRRKKRKIQKG